MKCRLMNRKLNQRKTLSNQNRDKLLNITALAAAAGNISAVTNAMAKATKAVAKAAHNSMEVSTNECTKV